MIGPLHVRPRPRWSAPLADHRVTSLLSVALATAPSAPTRLSDLLDGFAENAAVRRGRAYLADPDAVRGTVAAGDDPILYRAYRDVLPPRPNHDPLGETSPGSWYADLVIYPGGVLPGGREPHRSLGHWNAPSQLEIFQCLSGRVLMMHTGHDRTRSPALVYQVCEPGDHAVIPFGAWHLTIVLDGPAAVFNIYTDIPSPTAALAGGGTSRDAALRPTVKYNRAPAPRLAVIQDPAGLHLAGDPDELAGLQIRHRLGAPVWAHVLLEPIGLLAHYLDPTGLGLAKLRQQAPHHCDHGTENDLFACVDGHELASTWAGPTR